MNVVWIIGQEIKDGIIEPTVISDIGPSWGSYRTWQEYKTDNCVCNDLRDAKDLIKRGFNTVCNLYLPEVFYTELGRPANVQLFGGTFDNDNYPYKDDLVAINLGCLHADIVLMIGFDLSEITLAGTEYTDRANYYLNIKGYIEKHPEKQFVLINNIKEISNVFDSLDNLNEDSVDSVKEILYNKH